jgi:hypothetical protein
MSVLSLLRKLFSPETPHLSQAVTDERKDDYLLHYQSHFMFGFPHAWR